MQFEFPLSPGQGSAFILETDTRQGSGYGACACVANCTLNLTSRQENANPLMLINTQTDLSQGINQNPNDVD